MPTPLQKAQGVIFFKGCFIKNNRLGFIIQQKVIQEVVTKIVFYSEERAQRGVNPTKVSWLAKMLKEAKNVQEVIKLFIRENSLLNNFLRTKIIALTFT